MGPSTLKAAEPHSRMWLRTYASLMPIMSTTTCSGNSRARSCTPSNEPLATSSRTMRSAFWSMLSFMPRKRARRQVLRQGGAQLGVQRRVGGQGGAHERLVHPVVEAHRPFGRESGPVAQRVADRFVARERPHIGTGQVHHRGLVAQAGVGGIGIGQVVVGPQVDVGRCHGVAHLVSFLGLGWWFTEKVAVAPRSPGRATVRPGIAGPVADDRPR